MSNLHIDEFSSDMAIGYTKMTWSSVIELLHNGTAIFRSNSGLKRLETIRTVWHLVDILNGHF